VGSIAVAPFYAMVGFEFALAIGIVACVAGGVIGFVDRAMRHPPVALVSS